MSLTDGRRWYQVHEFHFARVLRARAILGKQVMSRTCVVRYLALSLCPNVVKEPISTLPWQSLAPDQLKYLQIAVN